MNSSKQSTQRRMLSPKNTVNSPRLAKLAGRSPNGKIQMKKTQTKTTIGSMQSLKDSKNDSRSSKKLLPVIEDMIPQRITQNFQHDDIQFPNKDRYEGGIKGNKMFGKGTYYFYQQNLKYIGEFYDNLFHGWGALHKNYGNQTLIYEGSFQFGQRHGQGKYEYGSNHYYNGNWAYDKKDGKGIYCYNEGLYNGEWKQNHKHGQGNLRLNDRTEYKGTFENDEFVKGLIKYPNGDQYSGQIQNGKREGEGSYFCCSIQQRYKGKWKNNKKHGRGTVFLQNGDQLQCTFINGQIDETQSVTYKWNSGPDEGAIFNGWFKNGRPQKGHVTRGNEQQFDTY